MDREPGESSIHEIVFCKKKKKKKKNRKLDIDFSPVKPKKHSAYINAR
jgi:hypothetical protein